MSRQPLLGSCLFVLSLGLAAAEPPTRPQGWQDLAGTWQPQSRERDGKKEVAPKDIADKLELVIAENRVIAKEDGKASPFTISARISPEKSPAWVDFIITQAGEKPDPMKTCPGIYKVEGETLTVCYREPHADVKRPTEFATKEGDDAILVVFKKKKAP